MMKAVWSRKFNFVELFAAFAELDEDKLSRRTLIWQLQQTFGGDLLVLSSSVIANVIALVAVPRRLSNL